MVKVTEELGDHGRTLSEDEVEETQELSDTTRSTGPDGDVSKTFGTIWLEEVVRRAEERRHMEEASRVNTEMVGTGDDSVEIPKTVKHLDINTSNINEGAARDYTEMDTVDTVTASIDESSYFKGGVALSREVVQTSRVDLVELARYHVSQSMARDVDQALMAEARANANKSVSGSRLTPDVISEAMETIEAEDYVPRYLVVGTDHMADLRTDSQFSNAQEHGNREVIQNGIVGEYFDLDVLRSTNINRSVDFTNHGLENDTSHEGDAFIVGQHPEGPMVGPTLAWKQEPTVEMEFWREQAEHRVFYDQAFDTVTIEPDAVCRIDV